jgi:uncharacterized protein
MGMVPGRLSRFFAWLIAKRWLVIAFYALILPPSAYYAAKVEQDNGIDRLIVPTDPDYIDNRAFQGVFGGGEYAVIVAEADDPFALPVLARLDRIEVEIGKVPRVDVNSALGIFRRAKAGFSPTPEQAEAFRKFVTGTDMIRKQGLYGDHFLALALVLDVHDRVERREALSAIDRAIDAAGGAGPPLLALRKVGQPYVNVYLDEATERSSAKFFGLFGLFVVVLNLSLYRSARTLLAFLITLGVTLAVSVGYVGVTGGMFTIVSPMVPMTILVTATATLVYLHSRFVDCPADRPVEEHRVFALTNKFVACTASIFATMVGFAALAISNIQPVRQMGIWVAVGLAFTWIIVFTLFPALQRVLRAPTSMAEGASGQWFVRLTEWLPRASYRLRFPLVAAAIALSAAGAVALFGLRGVVTPMPLLVNPVEYVARSSPLFTDTKRLEQILPGLSITEVWIKGTLGSVSEPEVLTGLNQFQQALEADPDVGSAVGVTTVLRMSRYIGGEGDRFPTEADAVEQLAVDLEGLVKENPLLQRFVQKPSLAQTHIAVVSRAAEPESFQRLDARIRARWEEARAKNPALKPLSIKTVGLGPLQAKMSQNLVPTLVESFGLTVAIIFGTFLLVFRSGAARLMAMIPSIFAILVMFGVMRVSGMWLNVATILIASTVLGTSENDQIHFFYHFLEKRKEGTVEEALRYTLRVSGKAIVFATLINAGGFLAFAVADLPPMRQFGVLSALALTLSMIADFTALPAALWIIFREKPDR